jgi:hypothetical protein
MLVMRRICLVMCRICPNGIGFGVVWYCWQIGMCLVQVLFPWRSLLNYMSSEKKLVAIAKLCLQKKNWAVSSYHSWRKASWCDEHILFGLT